MKNEIIQEEEEDDDKTVFHNIVKTENSEVLRGFLMQISPKKI